MDENTLIGLNLDLDIDKDQNIKTINGDNQINISYSQISTYNNCKYLWYQQYVLKNRKYSGNVNSIFGTSIHKLIQHYISELFSSKTLIELSHMDWDDIYKQIVKEVYLEEKEKNNNVNFLDSKDILSIYYDGINVFKYFVKKRNEYIQKKGWELVGIETPLHVSINENINFIGYLDVVLREKKTNKILILDLKTSLYGWKDKQKKDEMKRLQLQLYKKYYSEQYNIPLNDIEVRFLILKRVLHQGDMFGRRIQKVDPPSSIYSINKNYKDMVQPFIIECTDNYIKIKNKELIPPPHAKYATSCKYCMFYYKVANKLEDINLMVCPKWENKYNNNNKILKDVEWEDLDKELLIENNNV